MKIVADTYVEVEVVRIDGTDRLMIEPGMYMLPADLWREGQRVRMTVTIEPIAGDVVTRAIGKL